MRGALLLEQDAYTFIFMNPPMIRKYAFHLVMAGHLYHKSNQVRYAVILSCVCWMHKYTDGCGVTMSSFPSWVGSDTTVRVGVCGVCMCVCVYVCVCVRVRLMSCTALHFCSESTPFDAMPAQAVSTTIEVGFTWRTTSTTTWAGNE